MATKMVKKTAKKAVEAPADEWVDTEALLDEIAALEWFYREVERRGFNRERFYPIIDRLPRINKARLARILKSLDIEWR